METLEKMYEKPPGASAVFLMKKLFNLKENGLTIAEYVNQFNSVLAHLMTVKITFDDEIQAILILSGLLDG